MARFRRAERVRLLAARTMSSRERESATAVLIAGLDRIIAPKAGMTIAVYWPIRGEPDLRPWMAKAHAAGAGILLPVVVAKAMPLEFRDWSPDCPMTRGIWNIPVPVNGEARVPDIVLAPLVGIDRDLYRLGNGGGYYDRTLVRLGGDKLIIGVGQAFARMKTIFPMPWDIPMHKVVLGDGTVSGHSLG